MNQCPLTHSLPGWRKSGTPSARRCPHRYKAHLGEHMNPELPHQFLISTIANAQDYPVISPNHDPFAPTAAEKPKPRPSLRPSLLRSPTRPSWWLESASPVLAAQRLKLGLPTNQSCSSLQAGTPTGCMASLGNVEIETWTSILGSSR